MLFVCLGTEISVVCYVVQSDIGGIGVRGGLVRLFCVGSFLVVDTCLL